jgi:hypothetical protein
MLLALASWPCQRLPDGRGILKLQAISSGSLVSGAAMFIILAAQRERTRRMYANSR